MSNKNGLSAVSCSSYLDQRLFIARSLGQVLLLTLTPPEVGKSLVKLSRVSILTLVGWQYMDLSMVKNSASDWTKKTLCWVRASGLLAGL